MTQDKAVLTCALTGVLTDPNMHVWVGKNPGKGASEDGFVLSHGVSPKTLRVEVRVPSAIGRGPLGRLLSRGPRR